MKSAKELKSLGYRVVSRRHRLAARVDRPDWEVFCEKNNYPVDADFYRRVLSKDVMEIPQGHIKRIGSSDHDVCGYIEI